MQLGMTNNLKKVIQIPRSDKNYKVDIKSLSMQSIDLHYKNKLFSAFIIDNIYNLSRIRRKVKKGEGQSKKKYFCSNNYNIFDKLLSLICNYSQ